MLPSTRCRFASSSRAPRPRACRTPHPAEPRWAEDRASTRRLSASWSADGVGATQPTLSILSRHLLDQPDARQPPSRLASGSTRRLSRETHFEERAAAFRPSEGGRREHVTRRVPGCLLARIRGATHPSIGGTQAASWPTGRRASPRRSLPQTVRGQGAARRRRGWRWAATGTYPVGRLPAYSPPV